MNPIEFLEKNGINPHHLRTHLPQGPALPNCKTQYYHQNRTVRERPSAPPPAIPQQRDSANLSLLDRFLAAKGWSSNGKTQYAPLVPYLLADLVMLTHDEYLKDTLSGKAMHHCVFANEYHKKKDSLILSARDRQGNRIETVEVNTKTFQVVQSRGIRNQNTAHHNEIINLVNQNMHLIQAV
ncbi:MAG: PcfJ domain-containing protein [Bacteroidaceae bacterium]|nr:PcfJ domain-containing protein [Bacteroidaceae bacterium]